LFTGCTKQEEPPAAELVSEVKAPQEPVKRLSSPEYIRLVTTEAYLKVGHTNKVWDREVLQYLSYKETNLLQNVFSSSNELAFLDIAMSNGCRDPLLTYFSLREHVNLFETNDASAQLWTEAASKLDASGYPAYWKHIAAMRAAEALKARLDAHGAETNSPESRVYREMAAYRLFDVLKEKQLSEELAYQLGEGFINEFLWRYPNLRKWTYESAEPLLMEGWGDTFGPWAIKGGYYISFAWEARGSGFARTVTKEAWKLFNERLAIAREALEKAWSMKEHAGVAERMLRVEVGNATSREEMEKWFDRAMRLNPANYRACQEKLEWLLPKWHGSAKEARAFGLQCIANTNWTGYVPLILQDAHTHLARATDWDDPVKAEAYLTRADVWADIKASYERFFELNPDENGYRHDYALAAYKARAWEDLRKQLPLLGEINYKFFGGKEKFEEMVRSAEAGR
jgi:hypothetical protein